MSNMSYYGGFRTKTLAQIWNTYEAFRTDFAATPFYSVVEDTKNPNPDARLNAELTFYLLYARYGNSHIANSDINQFKYLLFSTIFMYGPSWTVRLNAQNNIRNLSLDELMKGSTATYNQSLNPGYIQSIDSTNTQKINSQNKTIYSKSKLEAYANLLALVETDVTEEFLGKFRKLFTKVTAADEDLLYVTHTENTLITED